MRSPALTWLVLLAGCPWIGFAEHQENHAALVDEADTDADTDTDTDADTDADTDTTGETGQVCVDDGQEPNDFANQAPLVTPGQIDGVLCPDDDGTDGPTDAYAIQVGLDQVLFAQIGAGATTSCADQTAQAEMIYQGQVIDRAEGACDTLVGGWGPGEYVVQMVDPGRTTQDYTLDLSTSPCNDGDNDDYLDAACGGRDCDDGDATISPDGDEKCNEAPRPTQCGDGIDQDCDGSDDLFGAACFPSAVGAPQASGSLDCGDLASDPVWDAWELPAVAPPDALMIVVRNKASEGGADLLAYYAQADGAHFGLDPSRDQFDDEISCEPSWTGLSKVCPGACVMPTLIGRPTLWIAQQPGAGCQDGATYEVVVRVQSTGATPQLTNQKGDDVVFAP
ncbi:MAG: putative metal-binding motif-containing protein [Alphaproteobacteria bacterium]|nr:putative metal-binding motif-containing protein [Alphaproteobacteria bacterium]MCB9698233.1 putative metal-binding motif-containing protein [Alphaproteobacteria bacterium]